MPVSFTVAQHPATSVNLEGENAAGPMGLTPEDILVKAATEYKTGGEVLQYSLSGVDVSGRDLKTKITHLIPDKNGLFKTVLKAYNFHHALILRPDDIWLAIVSQFNFFVVANAELLRANFVQHEGQKELPVVRIGTRHTVDFGSMAREMADLLDKNVTDPELCAWALPKFSTTTHTDTTSASVLLMSTLRHYFKYRFIATRCGIPRVTLEGEKADWVDILGRLEKLKEYGIETIAWYHLLRPIIARFVAAFDAPDSEENVTFWSKVIHHNMRSGSSTYSGWLNAFSVFSNEGKWLGYPLNTTVQAKESPESMTAQRFWKTYLNKSTYDTARGRLVLDDTPYHTLDTQKVASGYAQVEITLDDNGELFPAAMIAGSVGTFVSSSGDAELCEDGMGKDDTVRPVVGWWMFTKEEE
ncbi:hypothetical protein R3P38DRAFT_3304417 [Favolaschia claudopus]|uniref:Uncharacterized protein n=1 Tax=Favolaschia claudopus TaxID=2862362 RepID=A0AAW0E0B1_9AGAR